MPVRDKWGHRYYSKALSKRKRAKMLAKASKEKRLNKGITIPLILPDSPSHPTSEDALVTMDPFSDFFDQSDAECIRTFVKEYFERPEETEDLYTSDQDDSNDLALQSNFIQDAHEDETILLFEKDVSVSDDMAVEDLFKNGCKCSFKCTDYFKQDEIVAMRTESRGLEYSKNNANPLDIAVMAQIATFIATGSETVKTKKVQKNREVTRSHFQLKGRKVCSKIYFFAMAISRNKFRRLKNVYLDNGMIPPTHGNVKIVSKHAVSIEQTHDIINFLKRYAELHAIHLPRYNQNNFSIKLLPYCDNQSVVYRKYTESCASVGKKPIGFPNFKHTWRSFCRDITTIKPKNDMCEICQKNYTFHSKINSIIQTDAAKMELIENMRNHLNNVVEEEKFFNEIIEKTKMSYEIDKINVKCAHYSFDMAQNVCLPSNPLLKPLYFLEPFKVAIFGVMNDTTKVQHNFLIPENRDPGNGANAIISMLHYYFEFFSINEKHLYLHTSRGQYKNNYVLFYLLWRVICNLHESITLCFLPFGHTKLHNDWAFGLFKQKYKVTSASSMDDLCHIVTQSTPKSQLNKPVDVAREKIPFYQWQQFFVELQWKIPDISKQASFIFSKDRLNEIGTKVQIDENILYHKIYDLSDLDDCVLRFPELYDEESFNMSQERKIYLYKNIRQYCAENAKDTLCPEPKIDTNAEKPGKSMQSEIQIQNNGVKRKIEVTKPNRRQQKIKKDDTLSSFTSMHEQITDFNFSNSRKLSSLNELVLNLPLGWKQLVENNSLIFLKYNEQYEVERKVVIKNNFDVLIFLGNMRVNLSDYNTLKELTIDLAIQKCNNMFQIIEEMKVCHITVESTQKSNLLLACDSVKQDDFNSLVIIKEEPLDQNFEIGEETPDIDFEAEENPICDVSKEILIKQEPIEDCNNDNQT